MAPIHHIVLLHAAATANSDNISDICNDVLALKDKCVKDSKPYIKSVRGGKDVSIEGQQGGVTHVFIIEFESEADRNYYVNEDTAHAAVRDKMISMVGTDIANAQVVDFTPGAF